MKYQITILCTTNKYKPVSTLVENERIDLKDTIKKRAIISKGVQKICAQHYWGKSDLTKFGYTKIKIREYDIVKIKAENEARYNAIKEAKYASGEWKRPKEK